MSDFCNTKPEVMPPNTTSECVAFSETPFAIVIFGASGDLAKKKLLPALFRLYKNRLISQNFFIMGASRTELTNDAFRNLMRSALEAAGKLDETEWAGFSQKLFYCKVEYSSPASYMHLRAEVERREVEFSTNANRVFYLATPPTVYAEIIEGTGASGLASGEAGWKRIVIEKPHGRDLASCIELDEVAHRFFPEKRIFRIDHYLGKETVQNIVMLRFANSILEPVWNRRYIDHIQITAAETLGTEKRAGYYDSSGVLRDMFQNHMLQLLTLAAMEPPAVYESEQVRDERVKVLKAVRPMQPDSLKDHLVIGQYAKGESSGKPVPGYRDDPEVTPGSTTPTYAAMKVYIDNWRWEGVPFYLRSGKRMKRAFSEVVIQFKRVPHMMFKGSITGDITPNVLTLRIQPDERVLLKFHLKTPGSRICLRDAIMNFSYSEGYTGLSLEAYERVLLDCITGEDILFVRNDGVELSWAFLTPALDMVESGALPLCFYKAGSWGPEEADALMGDNNRRWYNRD